MSAEFWQNATVSAVIGAVAGGGVSLLATVLTGRGARRDSILQSIEEALEDLCLEGCAYWRTFGQDSAAESRIKTLFERVDLRIQKLTREFPNPSVSSNLRTELDLLSEDVTGGTFEVKSRMVDEARVASIKRRCSSMQDNLGLIK